MEPEVREAFRGVLQELARIIPHRRGPITSMRQGLIRQHGTWVPGLRHAETPPPDLFRLAHRVNVENFWALMKTHHENYTGLIGASQGGGIGSQPHTWATSACAELWKRRTAGMRIDDAIEEVLGLFVEYVSDPDVHYRCFCPIDGLHGDEQLRFDVGPAVVRPLSEEEVNQLFGSPRDLAAWEPWNVANYALILDVHEPKRFGEGHPHDRTNSDILDQLVYRTIVALRTFQDGEVGSDRSRFYRQSFSPFPQFMGGSGNWTMLTARWGSYHLEATQVEAFKIHLLALQPPLEAPLKIACDRLSWTSVRSEPIDAVIDACIGLEALLLAGHKSELRFRFALNFALLADNPVERQTRFREAQALYDLRSALAHGDGEARWRIGDLRDPRQISVKATAMLRETVSQALHRTTTRKTWDQEFWEQRYFGS